MLRCTRKCLLSVDDIIEAADPTREEESEVFAGVCVCVDAKEAGVDKREEDDEEAEEEGCEEIE